MSILMEEQRTHSQVSCDAASAPPANAPSAMPFQKYRAFPPIPFDDMWTERRWPGRTITRAPRWCSVDLRDGNQALINPMDLEKKMRMFKHLVKIGYKEIEVGFPSASEIDFEFCRQIIDGKMIPSDVWIQVLMQVCRYLVSCVPLLAEFVPWCRRGRN